MKRNPIIRWCLSLLLGLAFAPAWSGPVSLNGTWKLSYWKQPAEAITDPAELKEVEVKTIPAQVPGNVELDLLAAGLIADPMIGANVNKLRAWEGHQWCYSRRFTAPKLSEGQRAELWFGGIDCLADIWVNGKHAGSSADMLIERRFDVTDLIEQGGENTVQVIIRPVVPASQDHLLGMFSLGNFATEESVYIRKAPHMYGWDIMPRLVSAGLWRGVELRVLEPARFTDVTWVTTHIDTATRNVSLFVDFQTKLPFDLYDKAKLRFTLTRNGKEAWRGEQIAFMHAGRIVANLEKADLWWPRGYGEPALYEAKSELIGPDGKVLDTDVKRIGLRIVKLDISDIHLPDERGKFCFVVNGEKIFVRGTNWVPLDALHSRDAAQYESAIKLVTDANCNMIRCWGGNVYEDEQFFDICDEKGILVWQDFAMACYIYPQDEAMQEALRKEAICIVKKLRQHPSLLMWAGDNECDQSYILQTPRRDPNRNKLTRQVLPDVLFEHDYFRPYLPSSPYVDPVSYANRTQIPEDHLWGARQYFKVDYYSKTKARFVSEIGYHGCPAPASIKKYISADQLWPDITSRDWQLHATSPEGTTGGPYGYRNNLMKQQIMHLFGQEMETLEDFALASQLTQCEAMKFFVEMFRAQKGRRRGIIWWNLIDCWPQFSDAVVDYYYTRKLAYWTLQRSQWPVCLLISDAENGIPVLYGVNDTKDDCPVSFKVFDAGDGRKLVGEGTVTLGKDSSLALGEIQSTKEQTVFIIEYTVKGILYKNHFLAGKPTFDFQWFSKLMEQEDLLPLEGFEK